MRPVQITNYKRKREEGKTTITAAEAKTKKNEVAGFGYLLLVALILYFPSQRETSETLVPKINPPKLSYIFIIVFRQWRGSAPLRQYSY